MQHISPEERILNHELNHQPANFRNRYSDSADRHLRCVLFRSLARNRDDYFRLFFPNGPPVDDSERWSLRNAQGAIDGAEYTAAAKGTACGHIFKNGESSYQCKTCASDDTCVLCARCFEASDHEGHMVFVTVSPGNSGCCDCGDHEAWKREVKCTIHTSDSTEDAATQASSKGKTTEKAGASLPGDLVESIRMTIARVADYLCDIFSCSPEQLRLPKTEESIRDDERLSRLAAVYGEEPMEEETEFALILWNDEKHTVPVVENQVARACSRSKRFGFEKAMEVNDIGRSVIHHSTNVQELLQMAEIIEHLKLTVTIRSSRDTFREQMCATMIDWVADISGCSVGNDSSVLRNIICEEFLNPWRTGSPAPNREIGQEGIDDHEIEDNETSQRQYRAFFNIRNVVFGFAENDDNGDEDENEDDDEEYEMDLDDADFQVDVENIRAAAQEALNARLTDADMDVDNLDDNDEAGPGTANANFAEFRRPATAPGAGTTEQRTRIMTPADSDEGDAERHGRPETHAPYENVPKTPRVKNIAKRQLRPSKHWLEKPQGFRNSRPSEPCEDLWQRVRLDFLILYDLRLWKTLRIDLRHLYITTVVTIPRFRRILGLRFAGLYTTLAQLYLIADREPDHSIINLSVQMLTTPSITQEVVERGNFLTNLMAILYTFLTTRQVGFPEDVSPRATLAFDAGAVANRRMFHFFVDLRWLFQSEFIRHRMRLEDRYLLQFLDLVKLHQGVCPNVRALGEHVEYESDTWISASPIVKEVDKLCKQVAASFEPNPEAQDGNLNLQRALRTVAQVTMINSFGYERKRFLASELKDDMAWHEVGPFEDSGKTYSVPTFAVQSEPMSFHHPLHYLLSWLIENARGMSRDSVQALLSFSPDDLKDPWSPSHGELAPHDLTSDELLSAIFEHPLRVCVWLAQMKTAMWVRNGITLRHQAHSYRSVSYRDIGYSRDIFMVQAGLVLCGSNSDLPGERFLAQMIDRFQLTQWFRGDFSLIPGFEESQQIDVIEDFLHLLVIALSERGNLVISDDAKEQHDRTLEHDIAHALCFKPLSFSDLAARVTEKVGESDDFDRVLKIMTTYRAPEGLNDTGTFELKPEYIQLVDPYYAHYSRNHREEAEQLYRRYMAGKTGKRAEDIVYEPNLQRITSSLFKDLSAFTRTPLFVQVMAITLNFAAGAKLIVPKAQTTRIETFLHMALHLAMIATIEDESSGSGSSFIKLASSPQNFMTSSNQQSIVSALVTLSGMDDYASCQPTIRHILRKMQIRQPEKLNLAMGAAAAIFDRAASGSPASLSAEDKERKKQEALARQARVMAKMKEQQNSFLQNQGLSGFGNDFDDFDDMSVTEEPATVEEKKVWNFPTGTCIWCQEETDDQRLYGTFAFLGESNILRSTPLEDVDYVAEVLDIPDSLDRSADHIRPFGVSSQNKYMVQKVASDGKIMDYERQGLSKGFPHQENATRGPVATSCGHIMHFNCFELYLAHSFRRHTQQIARNHPENIELREFTCPLCKALGNTFFPIIWKPKECSQEHQLHAAQPFSDWILGTNVSYFIDPYFTTDATAAGERHQKQIESYSNRSLEYVSQMCAPPIMTGMHELSLESSPPAITPQQSRFSGRGSGFTRFFSRGRSNGSQSSIESVSQVEHSPRVTELARAYHRIDETLRLNKLCSPTHIEDVAINPIGSLSRALGLSVSAFEIAQRGTGNDPHATSVITQMSEQTTTHLRVLSETIQSYLAIRSLQTASSRNPVARETLKKQDILTSELFGIETDAPVGRFSELAGSLLLDDDVFLFFVDWLSFVGPDLAETINILQLCCWAEVVKTILVYKALLEQEADLKTLLEDPHDTTVSEAFVRAVGTMSYQEFPERSVDRLDEDLELVFLRKIVDKYTLTFLRKCIVVMYVRYGLDFECPHNLDPETPELQRLTALLHLRPLEEMFTLYATPSPAQGKLHTLTAQWITQAHRVCDRTPDGLLSMSLPHPAIFELVGLPKNYDMLTEEAIKRRCPTTDKEITDPVVCLQCGAIFCSQAVCCTKDKNKGGCHQHMNNQHGGAGATVGVFLNIRKCMVVFLHGPGNGSFVNAPYLDKHGETDPTLRRHHQLFLNQRRYDKLMREVWLQHQIPTVISRKLEADVNPGGWETL